MSKEIFNISKIEKTKESLVFNFELPRECGNCTACCKTHPILELDKPAREWCKYCRIGEGCKIYGKHPEGCKDFSCQWLFGLHQEEERPDKIGVVTDRLDLPMVGTTFCFFELNRKKLDENFTKIQTEFFIRRKVPVCHLPIDGNNKLYLPREFSVPLGYSLRINDKETDIIFV